MHQKSSERYVDKQERSPDQQHDRDEYDVDDFEVGVPSAKRSQKSSKKAAQDEISENYDDGDEFGSSYRSST